MKTRLSFPKIIGQKFQENLPIIFYVRENIVRRENSHFFMVPTDCGQSNLNLKYIFGVTTM